MNDITVVIVVAWLRSQCWHLHEVVKVEGASTLGVSSIFFSALDYYCVLVAAIT